MANNPVKHQAGDQAAWRTKWKGTRKPAALAGGAEDATETNLTVTHKIKDPDKFAKHVKKMEDDGKRKEMGAQNSPL
jgi:hypothetical protein